jgi:hypothetical protein
MLSASGCIFLRSKPQASLVRGGIIGGVSSSSRPFLLASNASSSPSPSSPPPAPAQEDSDCNEVECAPEKEVRAGCCLPSSCCSSFHRFLLGWASEPEMSNTYDRCGQVGSLSAEWLAEEKTRVVGTFPPRKKGWTGLVEKDTAGQTNIYSVEVKFHAVFPSFAFGRSATSHVELSPFILYYK